MNRLNSNVEGIRAQINKTVQDLDSLLSIIGDKGQPINLLSSTFRDIKSEYTEKVTNKIESIKKNFAMSWANRVSKINLNEVGNSTNLKNFKSYKNIKFSVDRGVPILTRYPKLKDMKSVLQSLDVYIQRNTAARKIQEASRAKKQRENQKKAANEARRANEARVANEARKQENNNKMRRELAQSVGALKSQVTEMEGKQFL